MILFSPSCFPNWSDSFNIFTGRPGLVGGELGSRWWDGGCLVLHLSSVADYLLRGGWSPMGVGVGLIVLCLCCLFFCSLLMVPDFPVISSVKIEETPKIMILFTLFLVVWC